MYANELQILHKMIKVLENNDISKLVKKYKEK